MHIVLGIDGGGTSTTCLIVDEKGNVLGRGAGGPSNFHAVGIDNAKKRYWNLLKMQKRMGR
jgi:N-acetylglucosamine kinase